MIITFFTAVLLLVASVPAAGAGTDPQYRVLAGLWREYDKAEKEDRPQDQLEALRAIKAEARSRRLAYDFFEAAECIWDVRSSINWKDWYDARKDFIREVEDFGEPAAVFSLRARFTHSSDLLEYARAHRSRLKQTANAGFYRDDGVLNSRFYSSSLQKTLANDWDYALWHCFLSSGSDAGKPPVLEGSLGGSALRYPWNAFIDYDTTKAAALELEKESPGGALALWEDYRSRYRGKAAELMGWQELLRVKMRTSSQEEDFKALLDECRVFERQRTSLSESSHGSECEMAGVCTYAEALIGTLTGKDLCLTIEDGRMLVQLTNIPAAVLKITKGGRTVWHTSITDTLRRFFVPDSVLIDFPVLNDGDYEVVCSHGNIQDSRAYSSHTLSIASRWDSRGLGVFVADHRTGEPVQRCDITLFDNAGKVAAEMKDLAINGFTPLPDSISSEAGKCELVASAGVSPRRMSGHHSPYGAPSHSDDEVCNCSVITDRSAFNPGETVHFKVIAWSGRYNKKSLPEGTVLEAVILNPDGSELCCKELVTDDFGSTGGEFELLRTERGGLREIRIEKDGRCLGSRSVLVDDFVLPTFRLEWEKDNRTHLPGDTLEICGKVSAYSGHSTAASTASYEIFQWRDRLDSGTVHLDSDGKFVIRIIIPDDRGGDFEVNVTVSDATGETMEFADSFRITGRIDLSLSLRNDTGGRISAPGVTQRHIGIVSDDEASFDVTFHKESPTASVHWTFSRGAEVLRSGEILGGGRVDVPVRGLPSGVYVFRAEAVLKGHADKEYRDEREYTVLKLSDDDTALCDDVEAVMKNVGDDPMAMQVGATGGRAWFVFELYAEGDTLLESRTVSIAGAIGETGSLETVRFKRREGWSGRLLLKAFLFRNGREMAWERIIEPGPQDESDSLPLSFTAFQDTVLPGAECAFEVSTVPGAECAVSVFDSSSESIWRNEWRTIYNSGRPAFSVSYRSSCGSVKASWGDHVAGSRFLKIADMSAVTGTGAVIADCASLGYASTEVVEEEAIPFMLPDNNLSGPHMRENPGGTAAWEPSLRSDTDGRIKFTFRAGDRLSTYIVQLFAHDRDMHTAVLRREMVTTLPVKLSVMQPGYLYEGDRYVVHATLSNSSDEAVSGRVEAGFFDGVSYKDVIPAGTDIREVTVQAGGSAECAFEAPNGLKSGTLGMLLRFIPCGGAGADALYVTVPLKKAVQTVTESHSALLRNGESRTALETRLRSGFVNVPGSFARDTLISIRQMLLDAVPEAVEPKSSNLLAILDALYANVLAHALGAPGLSEDRIAGLERQMAACRNADGGYAWFEGMKSSPVVTAAAMERLHRMAGAGYTVPSRMRTDDAARYLDKVYFDEQVHPLWCGGIGMEQYLHVRALYPVEFKAPNLNPKSWRSHRKAIKHYLVPSGSCGPGARILPKARRLATLRALLSTREGAALAAGWGMDLPSRLSRSVSADVESLLQYQVEHWSGGCYYPNAVMPWRGLLESELYAHNLLARLMEDCGHPEVADGIRLWMMIQKESQHWKDDPAYAEALGCIMKGSEELLRTSVLVLQASFSKPIDSIAASGNDITLTRRWLIRSAADTADTPEYAELRDGDVLHTGDRVRVEYRIWNRENRSFVKLSAPRPAALRPVEQLSGNIGWWLRPLQAGLWHEVSPEGYRSVLTDRTEYWFDTFPEEDTTVSEEFFVTQEGDFHSPVVSIESLYSPHYRANASSESPMKVRGR